MRTEEVERARQREHFYQRDFAYPAFTNFKLIDNELWLPGKTGRLVTLCNEYLTRLVGENVLVLPRKTE